MSSSHGASKLGLSFSAASGYSGGWIARNRLCDSGMITMYTKLCLEELLGRIKQKKWLLRERDTYSYALTTLY